MGIFICGTVKVEPWVRWSRGTSGSPFSFFLFLRFFSSTLPFSPSTLRLLRLFYAASNHHESPFRIGAWTFTGWFEHVAWLRFHFCWSRWKRRDSMSFYWDSCVDENSFSVIEASLKRTGGNRRTMSIAKCVVLSVNVLSGNFSSVKVLFL